MGKLSDSAAFFASDFLLTVVFSGCFSFNFSITSLKSFRSSDISIDLDVVPKILTFLASRSLASLRGVCPPYCTITPTKLPLFFSFSIILTTDSKFKGSK